MNRRRRVTIAITAVCALTVLAAPAHAAPAPTPVPPGASAAPQPRKSLEEVRAEIEALYRQAASATDAYNLAEEQAKRQSAEIVKLSKAIVDGRARIEELKRRAGAAARAQYRNGGIPEEARLVLTEDPQLFLEGANRLAQGQKATRDLLGELQQSQDDLETYTRDASVEWTRLEANRTRQDRARKLITEKIAAAEKLESQLAAAELERLRHLERQAQADAQTAWLASGALKEANRSATAQGRAAIGFALAQVGKPYVWGAEGPDAYDCSGLTQRAWSAAGRSIPRTSQEQWRLLPKVAIRDMRPGDLIIYYGDATHVGMYIGDGSMVHAPRPGRDVTVAGAGSMPILGVVRPDK
ncbi:MULTISPECIES: C40 family peptidase [Streptomyces]|uniref:Putative endopeptidase n=1 Tax=Streptomyces rubrolavendulae TaxID=285473 RepID=A0A1D8G2H1_9ACTN|nr:MULTISPECIES: C40 family peptidase [Streptomyces]AOT59652.1 putative endopeptidase precursor [Streptomyces rubrolavendulae]UQS31864.1 C40 family peptidase [Streptomyces fradiae]